MRDVKPRTEGSAIAKIPLGDQVNDLVTNPSNSVAYAALRDSIAVISSLHEVSCVIPVGGHPRALTIGADGSRLYAINHGGSVSVIDISDDRVGVIPDACCVQRSRYCGRGVDLRGRQCDAGGGRISVIDAGGATVAAIDGFDGYAITDLAADPEGNRVYVGLSRQSAYYQYDAGLLGVIDTATNAAIHTIDLGASPDTITVSPDGSMMYTTHYDHRCVSSSRPASFRVTPD